MQVVELRSVDDPGLTVERAVLVKVQLSEVAKLVERNDVGDFSGFFGDATEFADSSMLQREIWTNGA